MSTAVQFTPQPGFLYTLRCKLANGQTSVYKCIHVNSDGTALMANIASGWTCLVHDILRYPDGQIEWGYSTGGYFAVVPA